MYLRRGVILKNKMYLTRSVIPKITKGINVLTCMILYYLYYFIMVANVTLKYEKYQSRRGEMLYTYWKVCIQNDISKRGHTHKYPQLPLSVSKIACCVFSLVSGTLQTSVDEGLSGHKGSNPRPTALVFGRVP
jgi:hypothetical protein